MYARVVSEHGTESVVIKPPRRWGLVPKLRETVAPEFYILAAKVRCVINLLLLVMTLTLGLRIEELRFDPDVYWAMFSVFVTVHVVDSLLGFAIVAVRMSVRTMRTITIVSTVIETSATVFGSWGYGSVNSHLLLFALLIVLIYRLTFDFRIGVIAFGVTFCGLWTVVILEMTGVIPPQPIGMDGEIDGMYLIAQRQLGAMIVVSVTLIFVFLAANTAVARLRYKDQAIKMLRESLYAAGGGKVGTHTGKLLRDTYRLGVLLGTGGMGEVYEGTHARTRRKVAVKMLHPHLVEDQSVLKRFQREAEITGCMGSEHIVEVIDIDDEDGQPFLVLEYMEGESLGALVNRRGALPPELVADIVGQVASGLDVAHEAGVVHRDLKPENVFVCKVGSKRVAKILDFGVSKIRGNATALTNEIAILGTPDYMSPEQAVGRVEDINASADIFALGAVAYTALTGCKPFEASSVPALLRRICDEEPIPLTERRADLPDAEDVLAIAMAKRPDERYESAAAFARDLRAAIEGNADPSVSKRAARVSRGKPATRSRTISIDTPGVGTPAERAALETGDTAALQATDTPTG